MLWNPRITHRLQLEMFLCIPEAEISSRSSLLDTARQSGTISKKADTRYRIDAQSSMRDTFQQFRNVRAIDTGHFADFAPDIFYRNCSIDRALRLGASRTGLYISDSESPILVSLSDLRWLHRFYSTFFPIQPPHIPTKPRETAMSDRYASDFPEVRFAHLFITVVSLTNKLFQRMWSDSQKGLNALHTTVIAPSLLSVIATVTCTKAKLERIMGS